MPPRDPRIDAYIQRAAPFAQPILAHLREVVHAACPTVEETVKWGMPAFSHHGILCNMASFKHHATFGFWKHALIVQQGDAKRAEAMGSFGRITKLADLPSKKALTGYIKEAMRLNEEGVKVPKKLKSKTAAVVVAPADLAAALARDVKAKAAYASFSPSHRREYIDWITEAKRPETRAKRLATTVEWLREGKHRNWKYENC